MKIKSQYLLLSLIGLLVTITSCKDHTPAYLKDVKTITYQPDTDTGSAKAYNFTGDKKDALVDYLKEIEAQKEAYYIFKPSGTITITYDDKPELKVETNGKILGPIANNPNVKLNPNDTISDLNAASFYLPKGDKDFISILDSINSSK